MSFRHSIAMVAGRQHGVVSCDQIDALGVPPATRTRWASTGYLVRIHRGVYAVGHAALSFRGRCMAAVLAARPDARLSGAALAHLLGALRHAPSRIDVVAPFGPGSKARPLGARVRRTRSLPSDECASFKGIPTTTVARMLVDLADDVDVSQIAAVMHELEFLELLDVTAFERAIERHRTRRGPAHRRCVQALALHRSGSAGTQSAYERRTLDRLLEGGAPMPDVTPLYEIDGRRRRPDLAWPELGIVVEVDGPGHRRRRTRVDDECKEEQFASIGFTTLRIRHWSNERDIATVLRRLRSCDACVPRRARM